MNLELVTLGSIILINLALFIYGYGRITGNVEKMEKRQDQDRQLFLNQMTALASSIRDNTVLIRDNTKLILELAQRISNIEGRQGG